MSPRVLLLLLALGVLLPSCAALAPRRDPAPVVRGPLPSRNQHPVSLTFLHMRPRRAATLADGCWEAAVQGAYSSIYESDTGPGESVRFDGETARAGLRVRRGLGPRTDVEVEVSALYASGGFLDGIVNDFHDLFSLPDQGRKDVEDDRYAMRLRRNGEVLYDLEEDHVGLGDVPLVVTHLLRPEDERGPAVAARLGVELPAGSEERGFGNGALDWGGGLLLERSRGRWTWTGALDLVVPGQPEAWRDAGVHARELVSVQLGAEYRWSDRLSLLAQAFRTTPMTSDYTTEEFSREILDLAVGFAWGEERGPRWFAAFQEDLVSATGPDFGVTFGVTWGW